MKKTSQKKRPVALVTGASSGLGVEFVRQLAAKGYDLCITARRLDRLKKLKKEIEEEFSVNVMTCKADLSVPKGVDTILSDLKKKRLHIDFLVNNAGYGHFDYFSNRPFDDWEKMIVTNCLSLMRLTRELMPYMVSQKKGFILNVASVAGFMSIPFYAIYSSTKNMVLSFSEALHSELEETGVHISALCPGPVLTEFFDVSGMPLDKNPSFLLTTSELNVKQGLAAVEKNRAVVVPGFYNKVLIFLTRLLSRLQLRRSIYSLYRVQLPQQENKK